MLMKKETKMLQMLTKKETKAPNAHEERNKKLQMLTKKEIKMLQMFMKKETKSSKSSQRRKQKFITLYFLGEKNPIVVIMALVIQ
jgi:hypothetical protein